MRINRYTPVWVALRLMSLVPYALFALTLPFSIVAFLLMRPLAWFDSRISHYQYTMPNRLEARKRFGRGVV